VQTNSTHADIGHSRPDSGTASSRSHDARVVTLRANRADGQGRHVPSPSEVRKARQDPTRLLPAMDCLAMLAAWLLAYSQPLGVGNESLGRTLTRAAGLACCSYLLASHARLYDVVTMSDRRVEAARLLRVGFGTGLFAFVAPLFTHGSTNPFRALFGTLLSVLLVGTLRCLLHAWLRNERAAGRHLQSVAVVGYGEEADRLIEHLASRPDLGLRVAALAGDWETAFKHNIDWMGWPSDVAAGLGAIGVTDVVISPVGMASGEYDRVAQALARGGFHVYCSTGLEGVGHGRLRQAALANESFYLLAPPDLAPWQRIVKRVMDVTIAAVMVAASAPVLVAVAIAIKLGDRGPVFFRQVRVGRDGEPFTLFKFRTMVVDAEARLAELKSENARGGPLFKVSSDPRVTRTGRILRATSLDELPQLFNVLNGTMSLVGPRPALPSEVATFDQRHLERHRVLPGVTGLWQIEARDNPSFEAYRHLDVFYVENWSVGLDLVILWNTLPTIVARAVRSLLHRQEMVTAAAPAPLAPPASARSDDRESVYSTGA